MSKAVGQQRGGEKNRISPAECVLGIVLMVALAVVWFPKKLMAVSLQSRQMNNCKQILAACSEYASDMGIGGYPDRRPNREGEDRKDDLVESVCSAEACFQELFDEGILRDEEFLFWLPRNGKQCLREKPNADGMLRPGENYWDCIVGLGLQNGNLPLIFEASDSGNGRVWTYQGGHPWEGSVIVGFADGSSCRKEMLNSHGRVFIEYTSGQGNPKTKNVDLCSPVPGFYGWPETVAVASATQVNPDWQPPPQLNPRSELVQKLPSYILLGVCLISAVLIVCDRKRQNIYGLFFFVGCILFAVWTLLAPIFTKVLPG